MSEIPDHVAGELAALADGTLSPVRSAALRLELARSPQLSAAYEQQRAARASIAAVTDVSAPSALHEAVAKAADERARAAGPAGRSGAPWRGHGRLGAIASRSGAASTAIVASSAVLALLVAFLLVNSAGRQNPSVAAIVAFADRGSTRPAQARPPGSGTLSASVEGLRFPSWAKQFGWFANGERTGETGGRSMTVVYYARGNRQLSYAIVAGAPLSLASGRSVDRAGIAYRLLDVGGEHTVVWSRGGHTCVVSGRRLSYSTLMALAHWTNEDGQT